MATTAKIGLMIPGSYGGAMPAIGVQRVLPQPKSWGLMRYGSSIASSTTSTSLTP